MVGPWQALESQVVKIQTELNIIKEKIESLKNGQIRATVAPARTEFEQLKILLETDEWPCAVNPNLVCALSSEQDKQDRAESILDIIVDAHLEGLRFLDFGCGEGHVIARSKLQSPELAIGYDLQESHHWEKFSSEKIHYTSNWEEVVKSGPYNVILLYDVIDHTMNEDPANVIKKLRPLLKQNGKLFVRCHPFSSRHATHLYHELNKAYVHLIFTEEELESMGHRSLHPVRKIIHPLMTYSNMFSAAGFNLQGGPQIQKEPVEPFFAKNPLISKRIKDHWTISHEPSLRTGQTFPFVQLEQQFIDYVLL